MNETLFWRSSRKSWKALVRFCEEGRTVIGVGKPSAMAARALSSLPHTASFYDAMDDFPCFHSGLSRRAMERYEEEIVQRVDVVYASSTYLEDKWSGRHGRVSRIANACDTRGIEEAKSAPRAEPCAA